jgi:hypothetical protein
VGQEDMDRWFLNRITQVRYGTARVSKRLTDKSAACLRARYRTDVPMSRGRKDNVGAVSTRPYDAIAPKLLVALAHQYLYIMAASCMLRSTHTTH